MLCYTARLCLRPVSASDLDALFEIFGDPQTNLFNPAGPYPDRNHAEDVLADWLQHWSDEGYGNWAIAVRSDPETVVGFGGLNVRRAGNLTFINLGYRLATSAWGKGYATEFSFFALRYGFTQLHLAEISAVVRANHLASQRVLEKAGLRCVREIQDVVNAPPSLLFTLTAQEWQDADF